MRKISILLGMLLFAAFYACSENSPGPSTYSSAEDEAAIKQVLEEDDMVYEDIDDGAEDTYGLEDTPNWTAPESFSKRSFLRFGRKITDREKTIDVVFTSDTTATAYISKTYTGQFVSLTGTWSGDTSFTLQRFTKPLVHNVQRVVNLYKFRDDTTRDERRNWKREGVSIAAGESVPTTISIAEMILYPEGQDSIVITDPLEYFVTDLRVFKCSRDNEVRVVVKIDNSTANPIEFPEGSGSTENVRWHYGLNRHHDHAKKTFDYVGKDAMGFQVYEGTWKVRQHDGYHHIVLDVIDNGTILNSDETLYPYSSATWGSPYKVGKYHH
jgi:hypothetical protein